MAKQIIYGEEARKALQSGIDQLANTVPDADQPFDPAFRGDRSIYRRHSAVVPVINLTVNQREAEIPDAWICRYSLPDPVAGPGRSERFIMATGIHRSGRPGYPRPETAAPLPAWLSQGTREETSRAFRRGPIG